MTFDSMMARTVNRNLLKYSAGRSIFCPHCQNIADARRWVVVTQGAKSMGLCAPCWDKSKRPTLPTDVEVLDGRVLFARPERAKAAQ